MKKSATISDVPAVIGGPAVFKKLLPLIKPDFPLWNKMKDYYKDIYKEETIFTKGKYLKEFEKSVAEYIGVKHAIGVSSCTSGLMLLFKTLKLKGEVILPSFTFMATGQALMWQNDITPVFVDIDPNTFNIDPQKVESAITKDTSAIIAVHLYGNPANIDILENIAHKYKLKLIFDAAHGFGSKYKGKPIGSFGDAECFSCSPTKLLITGEGGIVTTNDDKLAELIRIGREYGNPGSYDSIFHGMNARMSEFNAVMGIESLKKLNKISQKRNIYVEYMKQNLSNIPGITFQEVSQDNISSYKDFTIIIEKEFELSRDLLAECLQAENIQTRNYYDPPLHLQKSYSKFSRKFKTKLPVTENIAKQAITLPLSSRFKAETLDGVIIAIAKIYNSRKEILDKVKLDA